MHVVGTAGHVDHGKSALVRALTGIEPDRLAEEQERGLTIDLGYAWMTLPSGAEIGVVDVPGHERFISTMLAGAGQSDVWMFVVDAREGWKPQSEEHLQILDLLGAKHGLVALTKVDVCADRASAVAGVRARIEGTSFGGVPIVEVSSVTGEGLDGVVAALTTAVLDAGDAPDHGRPRVWLDRAFSIKGAGTVVTGTLSGGRLAPEDVVEISPSGMAARVRRIQTHGRARAGALPVSRVALNLAGVEVADVARGDAVVRAGQWQRAQVVDVVVRAVRARGASSGSVRARAGYKVHIGSAETDARVTLLDLEEIAPDEEGFARLHLARALPLQPGDRFVLRDTGRRATAGGGAVLDVAPPGRARGRGPALAHRVGALDHGAIADAVLSDHERLAPDALARLTGSSALPAAAVQVGSSLVDPEVFSMLGERIVDALRAYHAAFPLAAGMPRDALAEVTGEDPAALPGILAALAPAVVVSGSTAHLATHRVALTAEQRQTRQRLLDDLAEAGFAPPPRARLDEVHGSALIDALIRGGDIVAVSPMFAWSSGVLADARALIAATATAEGPLTAARIKEVLGTTRKYVIPLLEYLDQIGFTRRAGDLRDVR